MLALSKIFNRAREASRLRVGQSDARLSAMIDYGRSGKSDLRQTARARIRRARKRTAI